MEQNLFDWLNETHSSKTGQETGLLLAPVNGYDEPEQIDTAEDILLKPYEPPEAWPEPDIPDKTEDEAGEWEQTEIITETLPLPTPEQTPEEHEYITGTEDSFQTAQDEPPSELWTDINASHAEEPPQTEHEEHIHSDLPEQEQSKEWQEAHTGFTLSLDEPPPEIWTRIDSPTEDDTEEEDYEQGTSLQGAAYIPKPNPKHGTNFTQRLQRTLQGRKERAAKLREEEEENTPHHPYIRKALIMCGTLLVALGMSWVCLWFLQDGVAAYLERARTEQEQPEVTETPKPETPAAPPEPEPVIVPITPKAPEKPKVQTKSLLTFDEALTEGNNAYNIGMYSRAIMNFHRAMALRENDIRPYIGLSASYRAKGMYFDAKRLLDEARIKFGRNPAIEMEQYYLRRE